MTERQYKDSGIELIDQIPSDWEIRRIKNCFQLMSGNGFPIEIQGQNEGAYPVFKAGDISQHNGKISSSANNYISDAQAASFNIFPKGTVIFPKIGEALKKNNRVLLGTAACLDNNCEGAIPYEINSVYSLYLFSCIDMFWFDNAGPIPSVSNSKLANFKIPYPDIVEQQQIADFLDFKTASIDSAIQVQKDIVEKLKEYRQAVITEAVTKGLNLDAEMKDSGIEWIGEIPSTWSVVPIKALFGERKHKNKDMQETNLLSLSYGNIKQKDINSNDGLLPENFSGYNIVETGDIVLRLTDLQNDHKSLRTGLVKEHGIITSAYVTLAPKHEVNSEYYHYLLHSYDIRKVFYTMGEGIRQSLDFGTLKKNVSILVPPVEEQKNIVEYITKKCESVENSIVRINAIIEKLEEYKKSIIYNAVTGKIDCRKDVIPE